MIANHFLHLVARVALRVRRPLQAKRIVDGIGRCFPTLSPAVAARAARELEGRGTCLTRALVIASRLPGSELVFGTDGPDHTGFSAHAWVEYQGRLIAGGPASRHELTRL